MQIKHQDLEPDTAKKKPHPSGAEPEFCRCLLGFGLETEKADTEPEEHINYKANLRKKTINYRWKGDGFRIGVGGQLPHAFHELLSLVTAQKAHRYGSQNTK